MGFFFVFFIIIFLYFTSYLVVVLWDFQFIFLTQKKAHTNTHIPHTTRIGKLDGVYLIIGLLYEIKYK